jgi:hypothetical protein
MKLHMGIIKVEIKIPELVKAVELFQKNNQKLFEVITSEIKSSVSQTVNQLLETELDLFLGQADQSNNKRNGFYEREFAIKNIGCVRIRMPKELKRRTKSMEGLGEKTLNILMAFTAYIVAVAFNYSQVSFQSQLRFEFQLNAADHAT